jgi:uncharacterized cupin superfamily protein
MGWKKSGVESIATLMAPGLTSPGGRLPDAEHALEAGQIVGVKADSKAHHQDNDPHQ